MHAANAPPAAPRTHEGRTRVTPVPTSGQALWQRILIELGGRSAPGTAPGPTRAVPLPSRLSVGALAWASVAAASHAAAALADGRELTLDPDRIAAAYASDRHLRVADAAPAVWAPLSGFFRSSDGWVRTHGNYPHHAAALRRGLGLPPDAGKDAVAAVLRDMPSRTAADAITEAEGLCVTVSLEDGGVDEGLRATPLVSIERLEGPRARRMRSAEDAPLRGIRVVDLTRVIAGPVATRTLALLGADVLRIDPPQLPEPEWQHFDTGHGKRSALLDLTTTVDRERFERLLARADVIVTGYRARALERLGLAPRSLIERHPGLVVARLSAWGTKGAAADRRGFDSLVQAESGIAWIESPDGGRPGALPVQALDHSAGYLLAAGVMTALARRGEEGGGWIVETSLRRVAAELLGMPRSRDPKPAHVALADRAAHEQLFDLGGVRVQTSAPAVAYDGGPTAFSPPRRWGRDAARWG